MRELFAKRPHAREQGTSTPVVVGDTAGTTPAGSVTGFVNAHSGTNNANAAPGARCETSVTFTPNIGSERFPRIYNTHGYKKLERVESTQKFQFPLVTANVRERLLRAGGNSRTRVL